MPQHRWLALLPLLFTVPPAPAAPGVSFNRDVRPILADKCFACHGPDKAHRKGDLRLDTADGLRAAVMPGKPAESELLGRVLLAPGERGHMPPKKTGKNLTASEIAILRSWIEQGAAFEGHWSFAPLRRPLPPVVRDLRWPTGPIDRFVLAPIEAAGRRPAAAADRLTLARRLYLDLLGLPPTPEQVDAFVADPRPDAYARLVDGLLASPAFGERMAAYWLDLVRYADTVGYHGDQEHAIWPYREWVIYAFNENKPFDAFTVEQLAGDLLPDATPEQKIATGYNRVLQTTHEGGAQDGEYRAKYAADRVRNLSAVWLGATVGCAECHDHKFDPYTMKDFYRLSAFFADVQEMGAYRGPDRTPTLRPPELPVLGRLDALEAARLDREIARLRQGKSGDKGDLQNLERRRAALDKRKVPTMVTVRVAPRPVRVLERGDWMSSGGEVVTPGVPAFLGDLPVQGRASRLDLARWLTSGRQPQTARTFVNRLWYLFFGQGLSRNLDDNGAQGGWPTHPELLDWLADEFTATGWDVKHLVRLLVSSAAYRQTSLVSPEEVKSDPENRLFARQMSIRLPAEAIRDAALAASGLLVQQLGGPGVRPYQPEGYYIHLNFPKRTYRPDSGPSQYRRGVYTHWQRQFLHPMLKAFDAPSREECTAARPVSNTPLQALALLNDPSFVEAARGLAVRVLAAPRADADHLDRAWRLVLSRQPEPAERAVLTGVLAQARQRYRARPDEAARLLGVGLTPRPAAIDPGELAAWTAVTRVLLNLDEALTRN